MLAPLHIIATLALALLCLSGCASIVSDKNYMVSFNSVPDGADVIITNEKNIDVHRGMTPFSVSLPASNGYFDGMDYSVRFEKACYKPSEMSFESSLDAWYWGNLLFGGLIGFFIVDPATGDMWELDDTARVALEKDEEDLSKACKAIEARLRRPSVYAFNYLGRFIRIDRG